VIGSGDHRVEVNLRFAGRCHQRRSDARARGPAAGP
jgi:hypothetical protein